MEEVKEKLPSNYVTLAQLQRRWKKQQNQPHDKLLQNATCNNDNPPNYLTLAQLRERRNQQQNDNHNQLNDDAKQIQANCPREEEENRNLTNGNDLVQRSVAVVGSVEKGKEKVGEENAGRDKKITHTGRYYNRGKNRIYKGATSGDSRRYYVVQVASFKGNDIPYAVDEIRESENDVKVKKTSSGNINQINVVQVGFSEGNDTVSAVEGIRDVKKKISSLRINQNDVVQVAYTTVGGNCESENGVKKKWQNKKQRKNVAKEKLIKEEDQAKAQGEKEDVKVSVCEVQVSRSGSEEKSEIAEVKECEVQVPQPAIEEKSKIAEGKECEVHAPVTKRGKEKVNVVYRPLMNVESKTVEVEAWGKHKPMIRRGSDNIKTKIGNHRNYGIERPSHSPLVDRGLRYEIKNDMRRIDFRPKDAEEEAREVAAVGTIQEEGREVAAVETLEKGEREMVSVEITIEEARDVASVETVQEDVKELASVETLEKEGGEMVSVEITIEDARDVAFVETIEKRTCGVLIEEQSNERSKMTVDDNSNSNSNNSVNKDYNRSIANNRNSQYRGNRYTYNRFQNQKNFEYKGYGYNGMSRNSGYGGGGARRWADDTRGRVWVKKGVVTDVGEGTGA